MVKPGQPKLNAKDEQSKELPFLTDPRPTQSFGSLKVRPPLASSGQRIGLLGGSFNPPHEGHLHISEVALSTLGLDNIWWLVSPGNPIKSHDDLMALENRLAASRALINHPRIKVTGFEASMPTSYTAETLKFLTIRYPSVNFVWLMGADNLLNFHRWQKWQDIFMNVPIAVFDRPGYRLEALVSPAAHRFRRFQIPEKSARLLTHRPAPAWTFITHPLISQSSTALRAKAQ